MIIHKFFSFKKVVLIAGVDESGCGSLVGSVIASAVVLHYFKSKLIFGLTDSKTVSEKKRLSLYQKIKENSLAWSFGSASVAEIDHLNILQARLLAIKRAILNLPIVPDLVLTDGNHVPNLRNICCKCLVKGDKIVPLISAASILAKVKRDRSMKILDNLYPKYRFSSNKGYPTRFHLQQLKLHGPTKHHRTSFSPIKNIQSSLKRIVLNK